MWWCYMYYVYVSWDHCVCFWDDLNIGGKKKQQGNNYMRQYYSYQICTNIYTLTPQQLVTCMVCTKNHERYVHAV